VRSPVDLVLADPPYADLDALRGAVELLGGSTLLLPSSVAVLEQAGELEPLPSVGALPLHTTRVHGRTRLSLYAA
jgi:16S rRNA G966 N2-methylase RsmD